MGVNSGGCFGGDVRGAMLGLGDVVAETMLSSMPIDIYLRWYARYECSSHPPEDPSRLQQGARVTKRWRN